MLIRFFPWVLVLGLVTLPADLPGQDASPASGSAPATVPQQSPPVPEKIPVPVQTPAQSPGAPQVLQPSQGPAVNPVTAPTSGAPGPQQAPGPAMAPIEAAARLEVQIGSGDLLIVSVFDAPDYHYEVRVNSKGSVGLPLAGDIQVAGLTTTQAEAVIARRLREKGIFNEPQVSVFEKEYATQGISVMGEVQKPGIYPLMGPRTLADVISAAGGLTPRAGDTATITRRAQPRSPQTVKLIDRSSPSQSEAGKMTPVYPGDTVVFAKAGIVYVVGDVKEPAGFVMENNHMTVLQAMAMAHGANPTARLSAGKLVRSTPNGPQEVPVQLNKILSAQLPDMALQPGDILFIPNSKAKTITHKSLDAILNVAAAAAIYH